MIPVGTLCYVVRTHASPSLLGRVVVITGLGKCGSRNHIGDVARWQTCIGVGQAKLPDGTRICVQKWSDLCPITPPPEAKTTQRDKELTA